MRIFELNQLKYKFFFLFLERNNFENSINGILELFYLKEYDYDTFLLAEQGNKSIEDSNRNEIKAPISNTNLFTNLPERRNSRGASKFYFTASLF